MANELHKIYNYNTNREIGLYVVTIICVILALINGIGLFKIWRKREYPFIKKRHPILVSVTVSCIILTLAFERPLSGFARISTTTSNELQWIRWIISVIFIVTQTIGVFFRIYVTCFDVAYFKASAKTLWVKHIDNYSKVETSWIVSKYSSWGNLHKIYPYIIALTILLILIIIIPSIFYFELGFFLNALIFAILNILMLILWCNTPRYLDHFKIRGIYILYIYIIILYTFLLLLVV